MRSKLMSRIRTRDTAPELAVRSIVHRMGYRFRIQRRDLPGRPDLVLPRLKVAIFVHGCFWHHHPECSNGVLPKSNRPFWSKKFRQNRARDREVEIAIRSEEHTSELQSP